MGDEHMRELAQQIMTDPVFRDEFQLDPQGAAASSGITLSQAELDSLTPSFPEGTKYEEHTD